MKKYGLNQYIKACIGILLASIVAAALIIAVNVSIAGEGALGDLYFIDVERILEKGEQVKIIHFGASTAQSGIDRELFPEVELMATSAQSLDELMLLLDYLEQKGYSYTKDNYLLLDMGTSTIRKAEYHNMAAVANINTWGDFYVNQDLELERKSYWTSAIKRYLFAIEHNIDTLVNTLTLKVHALEDKPEVYEAQLEEWNTFTKDFEYIDEAQKKAFEEKILELEQKTNVVVNFVYITQAHADSKEGVIFNQYIDQELKPFLEEHGIAYIDSRNVFAWEDYEDRAHLTQEGQLKYTDFMKEEFSRIMQ